MTDVLNSFISSLDRLDVGWTRTSSEALTSAVESVTVPPAVGAPLPFDGLSIDGLDLSLNPTPAQLDAAQTGVTAARMAIANYGTVVIQSEPDATEAASLFPALHIAILRASDIVPDMPAAFQHLGPMLREAPTSAILATGPSATADMGALVRGAHGPKRVHVVIVDDQ